jgi:cytochrome c-type biogenesis protein CcmF
MVTWLFLTLRNLAGNALGVCGAGLGRLLGMGPGGDCQLHAVADRTAFLHSVMMQEKKGMMKSWNVWLIFITFLLTMLGTLLTRAGLVSSVHAFAQSSIGTWFVIFMGIVLAVCIFTYILQRSHLKSEHQLESLVSRESSFPVQQPGAAGLVLRDSVGHAVSDFEEYVQGQQGHGGRAVL